MDVPCFSSIVELLESVIELPDDKPLEGNYATGGLYNMPLPSLSLAGSPEDILGLPISNSQAKEIISSSTVAPVGQGEAVASVDHVWEWSPTEFSINNTRWDERIEDLLTEVKKKLGFNGSLTVTSELYKLLLFEPGGMYRRDSDDSEGMMGTLVIETPSNYTGGKLTVYHNSQRKNFEFGGSVGCSNFHYVALHADCQLEIKPITKGYRLCLVYDLVQWEPDSSPEPDDNQEIVSGVVSSMKEWVEDQEHSPPMMVYLLKDKYFETSLDWDGNVEAYDVSLMFEMLKDVDRAVADVLTQAKETVYFDLYLATVSLIESWSVSGSFDSDFSYSSDLFDNELIDRSVTAKNLTSRDGKSISSIELKRKYLVPEEFFDDVVADKKELKVTRNNGAKLDVEYHRAALLLWPLKHRTTNLGVKNVLQCLKEDVSNASISSLKQAELEAAARELIHECALPRTWSLQSCVSLLQILLKFDKVELILEFLDSVASVRSDLLEYQLFYKEIFQVGLKCGWDILKERLLNDIFEKIAVEKKIQLLLAISSQLTSETHKDICCDLASIIMQVLSDESDTKLNHSRRGSIFFLPFIKCLMTLSSGEQLLATLADILTTKPQRYPVVGILVPVCESLYELSKEKGKENVKMLSLLLSHCIAHLELSSSCAIPCPVNWSELITFSCSCRDCVSMLQFLAHPTKKVQRFKMGKKRCDHLQSQLCENGCSVAIATEDNPKALVVTKTRQTYQNNRQQTEKEKKILSRLQVLHADFSSGDEPAAKRHKIM